MTVINYPASSPYAQTPQYSWRMGIFKRTLIPPDASDIGPLTIDLKHEHNPVLLSQDFYNAPTLWWVFSARNIDVLRDPIWDLTAGKSIYIPALNYLQSLGISP